MDTEPPMELLVKREPCAKIDAGPSADAEPGVKTKPQEPPTYI